MNKIVYLVVLVNFLSQSIFSQEILQPQFSEKIDLPKIEKKSDCIIPIKFFEYNNLTYIIAKRQYGSIQITTPENLELLFYSFNPSTKEISQAKTIDVDNSFKSNMVNVTFNDGIIKYYVARGAKRFSTSYSLDLVTYNVNNDTKQIKKLSEGTFEKYAYVESKNRQYYAVLKGDFDFEFKAKSDDFSYTIYDKSDNVVSEQKNVVIDENKTKLERFYLTNKGNLIIAHSIHTSALTTTGTYYMAENGLLFSSKTGLVPLKIDGLKKVVGEFMFETTSSGKTKLAFTYKDEPKDGLAWEGFCLADINEGKLILENYKPTTVDMKPVVFSGSDVSLRRDIIESIMINNEDETFLFCTNYQVKNVGKNGNSGILYKFDANNNYLKNTNLDYYPSSVKANNESGRLKYKRVLFSDNGTVYYFDVNGDLKTYTSSNDVISLSTKMPKEEHRENDEFYTYKEYRGGVVLYLRNSYYFIDGNNIFSYVLNELKPTYFWLRKYDFTK